jgi:hypothetical protein
MSSSSPADDYKEQQPQQSSTPHLNDRHDGSNQAFVFAAAAALFKLPPPFANGRSSSPVIADNNNNDGAVVRGRVSPSEAEAPVVRVVGEGTSKALLKGGDDGGNLNTVVTAASQEEETTANSSKAAPPAAAAVSSAAVAAFNNKLQLPGKRELHQIATSAGKTFVRKLHTLLTTTPNEYSSIISWNDEGTSVIVHDVDAFISTVMPVHYKHSKFESWARRMRRWGFAGSTTKKRWAAETDASNDGDGKPVPLEKEITKMEFTNELFTRDRPELVALMMDERKAKKQVVVQRLYNSKVGGDEINSVAIGGRVMKRQISSLVGHSNKANAAKKQRVKEMEEARLKSGVCVHKPTWSSRGGMPSSEDLSSFDRERAAEAMAISAARAAGFNEMTAAMMNMKKNSGAVGCYNSLQSPYHHHHHRSGEEYSLLPPPPPKLHSYGMMMKMMLPPPPPPSFHHYPPPHYPPPPHSYDGYGVPPIPPAPPRRYGDSPPPPQFFDLPPPPRGYPPSHLSYQEHLKMKEEHLRQMAMMRMHQRSHQPPCPSVPRGLPHQPVPAAAATRAIQQTTEPVNLDVVFKRKAGVM